MSTTLLYGDTPLNVKSKELRGLKIRFLDLLSEIIVGIQAQGIFYLNLISLVSPKDVIILIVYRCLNGSFPMYMSDMLSYARDINSCVTSHTTNNNLYVLRPRVEMYRQSFQYTGPIVYNNISQDVKNAQPLSCFKVSLKSHSIS